MFYRCRRYVLRYQNTVHSQTTTTQDIRTLLTAICELRPSGAQEEAFHSLVGQAVTKILFAWKQGEERFVTKFGDLRNVYAKDYGDDRRRAYTAYELLEHRQRRQLFARNAFLCNRLQACLKEESIFSSPRRRWQTS